MSMAAYRWALSWNGLSSAEKFVLVVIADHYNERVHRAWPSIDTIARYTALGRSTVKRAIKRLEQDHGLVDVEPWLREGTKRALNNRYCLPMFDPLSNRSAVLPVYSGPPKRGATMRTSPWASVQARDDTGDAVMPAAA